MRLIDAEKLENDLIEVIKGRKTIEIKPVRHGDWLYTDVYLLV